MPYSKDPVGQNIEDAYWGSQGVPVPSPAGLHAYQAYQERTAAQPDSPPPIPPPPTHWAHKWRGETNKARGRSRQGPWPTGSGGGCGNLATR
jgi:hypothetical protein